MDKRYYNRYSDLINKLNYTYKGYNLKDLLPGYFTWVFDDNGCSSRDIFKVFYTGVQLYDLSQILNTKKSVAITFLINRSDYRELAEASQKSYPDSDVINIESLPQRKTSLLSLSYIKHFCKAFSVVFTRSIKESFKTKLYLVGQIIKVFNYIQLLEKAELSTTIERYICFNSAYMEESILTVYFKKRSIETITMQHGIFCDFKLMVPFDYINYGNLIADKILCWGQSTIDYLSSKGFDESRFILMGNPKYMDTKIDSVNQSFKKCLVLLGRQIYIPSNEKLLSIIKEYNQTYNNKILFYIKKHPFLMDSDHKSFASVADNMIFVGKEHSVQEILRSDLVDFTIAVNTTAYYESLALGKISLRWTESENEDFVGMDDKFISIDEFEGQLEKFRQKSEIDTLKEMKEIIKYVFNPNLQ